MAHSMPTTDLSTPRRAMDALMEQLQRRREAMPPHPPQQSYRDTVIRLQNQAETTGGA
jgi:hypothetical protein